MKKELTFTSRFEVYDSIKELDKDARELLEAAIKASQNAYAPYSKFNVGAAVRLDNGEIISGNNQENAAYPSGLCAERVALFYASAQHPDKKIISIAITTNPFIKLVKKPISPCGACRQVMTEYEAKYKEKISLILFNGKDLIYTCSSVAELLPLTFTASDIM